MYLEDYYKNHLPREQLELCYSLFDDDDKLLSFICYSYKCYEELHSKGSMAMITNPEALFMSYEDEKKFITELKTYIMDVLEINREDIKNGRYSNYRSQQNHTENQGQ